MKDDEEIIQEIVSEVKSEAEYNEKDTLDFFRTLKEEGKEVEDLAYKENHGIITMRRVWSTWILIFIGIIIIFDIILVFFYGIGVWTFKDSNVVIAVITENFLKILALGILITQSLFTKIFK